MSNPEQFQLFNLETMSGVFPGRRTQLYQRVRLYRLDSGEKLSQESSLQEESGSEKDRTETTVWAQILWYDSPFSCVVNRQIDDGSATQEQFLLRITNPQPAHFDQQLQDGLKAVGWGVRMCGSCQHWQPGAKSTAEELPVGRCALPRQPAVDFAPDALVMQGSLALDCPHWHVRHTANDTYPNAGVPHAALPRSPLPKVAEVSESKLKFLPRLWRRLLTTFTVKSQQATGWQEGLLERSGVGAGTEACFACQGRIANLGALTVDSDKGDKQTFSVWRCRNCYTLYLSDWTDRWERLESLETEEFIYRIAPVEAAELLGVILGVAGGEHPAHRSTRTAERQRLLRVIAGPTSVSHQIKQGR